MRQAFNTFVRQLIARYTTNPVITEAVVQAADSLEQQLEQSIGLQPASGGVIPLSSNPTIASAMLGLCRAPFLSRIGSALGYE
jgi:urease alpha subunit